MTTLGKKKQKPQEESLSGTENGRGHAIIILTLATFIPMTRMTKR